MAKQKAGQELVYIQAKVPKLEKIALLEFSEEKNETMTFIIRRAIKHYMAAERRRQQRLGEQA